MQEEQDVVRALGINQDPSHFCVSDISYDDNYIVIMSSLASWAVYAWDFKFYEVLGEKVISVAWTSSDPFVLLNHVYF